MSRPTLAMSQLIATDAPILSPLASPVDGLHPAIFDSFAFHYAPAPTTAPVPSLKTHMRLSPEAADPDLCIPTHQVFDFALDAPDERYESEPPHAGDKRPADALPPTGAPKKARGEGHRITTKEFVPPDVSGLSKREARLVKNRAAAFLSRQRKREEFEQMEIRVAELERENARLRSGATLPEDGLLTEVQLLRAQLAASEQRARELGAQLTLTNPPIKLEQIEPEMPSRSPSPALSSHRSAASIGLMVLLCALPTLLSMQTHPHASSHVPGRLSFPLSAVGPHADAFSAFIPNGLSDLDLDLSSAMDIDFGDRPVSASSRLEFPELGLGDLDISFDAAPADDGRIRVRIHHPDSEPLARKMSWQSDEDPLGPFLGVGDDDSMGMASAVGSPFHSAYGFDSSSDAGSEFDALGLMAGLGGAGSAAAAKDRTGRGKRRVRIALKSMPKPGGEGGEWEVQLC